MTDYFVEHVLDPRSSSKALFEAKRRQQINEQNKLTGRNSAPAFGAIALQMHLLGARGELATAQYLNLEHFVFQDELPVRGSVDLPPNIDVKTRSKHWMDLVVQLDDDPKKIFVHATAEDNRVRLHGWGYGERLMKPVFHKDPAKGRPAYFVRPWALQPMQLLKDILIDLSYSK